MPVKKVFARDLTAIVVSKTMRNRIKYVDTYGSRSRNDLASQSNDASWRKGNTCLYPGLRHHVTWWEEFEWLEIFFFPSAANRFRIE
ncbi:hypothetical protein CEXT_293201 [Caerostris extrusa]|uniref:Uncharacterized protein n=1 Tax=Caerostris extrusa TaxID=172846 RepID=A0AAV4U8D8_CAEEX|nr:hypothetical protein CEXT_293201 [Caerostris extrusa]